MRPLLFPDMPLPPLQTGRMVFAQAASEAGEEGPVNCVVDGGFDDPAQWSGPQFTVTGSKGVFATSASRIISNLAGTPALIGHTYRLTIDVTAYTSGTGVRMFMGGAFYPGLGLGLGSVGTFTQDIVAIDTSGPRLYTSGAGDYSVDNYSVIDLG